MSLPKSNLSPSSSPSSSSSFERQSSSEDFEDYKQDGYHPVTLSENFKSMKYQVIQKLGWGHFSTVWLVNEKKTENYFALKIQKSKKTYFEAAMDEIEILKKLQEMKEGGEWRKSVEEINTEIETNFKKEEDEKEPGKNEMISFANNNKKNGNCNNEDSNIIDEKKNEKKESNKEKGNECLNKDASFDACEQSSKENGNTKISLQKFRMHSDETFVIRLHDDFVHFGIHGKHPCLVMEVMGPNLLDLIQHFEFNDKSMNIKLVKLITIQILIGLDYMHRICGVIHTDLKPENIMIQLNHFELEDFVRKLQMYKKKPISMKFLKSMKNRLGQASSKNKKKYQKKKDKKKEKTAATNVIQEAITNQTTSDFNPINSEKSKTEQQSPSPQVQPEPHLQDEPLAQVQFLTQTQLKSELPIEPQIQPQPQAQIGVQTQKEAFSYDVNILRWKENILIPLDSHLRIKIVDFGNACWTTKHFTDNIQTREYRSPETILGHNYSSNTDIWSLACIVFEMLTNSFLFKPKKGEDYGKNDDHLALMMETLGKIPKSFALGGKRSREFFNKNGQLIRIKHIKDFSISEILIQDFKFEDEEAKKVENFLRPMLEYDPKKRIDARTALKSKWLWE